MKEQDFIQINLRNLLKNEKINKKYENNLLKKDDKFA